MARQNSEEFSQEESPEEDKIPEEFSQEEISLEECVEYLLQKVSQLEEAFATLAQEHWEFKLDHLALMACVRTNGTFNKDVFRRYQSLIEKEMLAEAYLREQEEEEDGESDADGSPVEGDDRG